MGDVGRSGSVDVQSHVLTVWGLLRFALLFGLPLIRIVAFGWTRSRREVVSVRMGSRNNVSSVDHVFHPRRGLLSMSAFS